MSDSESVFDKQPDGIGSSLVTGIGFNTLKKSLLIFIIFIVVHSDMFIDRVMSKYSRDLTSGRQCTDKGTMVQGLIVAIGFILINFLVESDYI